MIHLDYRDTRPIYEQVKDGLRKLMVTGMLRPGDKLPSVRSLAVELAINPNTIQRAYTQLEQDGYIYTILGRGNYVTDKSEWQTGHFKALRSDFTGLLNQAKDAGMPRQELLALIDTVYGKVKEEPT